MFKEIFVNSWKRWLLRGIVRLGVHVKLLYEILCVKYVGF